MAALSIVSVTTGATSGSVAGAADWRLFGPPDNTKSGGGGTISGLTAIGGGAANRYSGDPYTIPYTGGTPSASGTWDGNVYNDLNDGPPFSQTGNGLEFTLPADTSSRRARIDLSAYEAVLAIQFHLSDSSAADVSNTTTVSATVGNVLTGVAIVDYAAASAGQTLRVRVLVQTANGIAANSAVFAAQWVLNAAGGTSVAPGVGSIAITGPVPTVARTANQALSPAAKAVVLAGFAPTLARTANQALVPAVGALSLTGFAPTVTRSNGATLQPAAGAVTLTGLAPTIARTANQGVAPAVGALTLTGFAPSVVQAAGSVALVPGAGVLQITGYAPAVAQTAQDVSTGGGIDPAPFYRYSPPQKKKAHRERDWLDREGPVSADMGIPMSAPMATVERTTDADDALVALLLRSGLSLMQAQEQLAERMEAQRAAALIQMARETALQDEDDIAALLLML